MILTSTAGRCASSTVRAGRNASCRSDARRNAPCGTTGNANAATPTLPNRCFCRSGASVRARMPSRRALWLFWWHEWASGRNLPATVRCSPHTYRHTFAVMSLRNGANIFSLKQWLGHESLTMVNRYLALSQADSLIAHRLSSPADRLKDAKGGR
ncbi:MAG: site-specific integrase [Armatimonadetes bacterium]|nr:site-specific integrase [Armatimonadota bacterium]